MCLCGKSEQFGAITREVDTQHAYVRLPLLSAALPDQSSYHNLRHLSQATMAGKGGSGGGLPGFPGAGGSGAPFDFSALQGILNVRVTSLAPYIPSVCWLKVSNFCTAVVAVIP